MPAAGSKGPHAGNPIAAFAFDGANPGAGPPGQHRARIAEDRLRYRQVEIGCRHRAAAGLAEAPGRGGVGLGDGFDDVEEGDGIGFDPVGRARQQQAEQLRVVQPVEQGRRQPARCLRCRRKRPRYRRGGPRPGRSPPGRRQGRQNLRSEYSRPCLPVCDHAVPWATVHCWRTRLYSAATCRRVIGKPMTARSTSANKRCAFRAALHECGEAIGARRRYSGFRVADARADFV